MQDPEEAAFPAMPANVLEFVEVDHIVPIAELAALLTQLTAELILLDTKPAQEDLDRLEIELAIARHDNAFRMGILKKGNSRLLPAPIATARSPN